MSLGKTIIGQTTSAVLNPVPGMMFGGRESSRFGGRESVSAATVGRVRKQRDDSHDELNRARLRGINGMRGGGRK